MPCSDCSTPATGDVTVRCVGKLANVRGELFIPADVIVTRDDDEYRISIKPPGDEYAPAFVRMTKDEFKRLIGAYYAPSEA